MQYDTFYTINYRGMYIHAKRNRALNREEFTINGYPTIVLPTLRSAKLKVSKLIGKGIK